MPSNSQRSTTLGDMMARSGGAAGPSSRSRRHGSASGASAASGGSSSRNSGSGEDKNEDHQGGSSSASKRSGRRPRRTHRGGDEGTGNTSGSKLSSSIAGSHGSTGSLSVNDNSSALSGHSRRHHHHRTEEKLESAEGTTGGNNSRSTQSRADRDRASSKRSASRRRRERQQGTGTSSKRKEKARNNTIGAGSAATDSSDDNNDFLGTNSEDEVSSSDEERKEIQGRRQNSSDFVAAFDSATFVSPPGPSTFRGTRGGETTALSAFSTDFGSFPTDFGSFPMNNDSNHEVAYEPPNFGTGGSLENFSAPPAKTFDTSPIEHPPVPGISAHSNLQFELKVPRPVLVQQSSTTAKPIGNPLNGNILMCRKKPKSISGLTQGGGSSEWQLVEWNPKTKAQVMSVSLFNSELQRKIAQKYHMCASAVDHVVTVATGVHHAHGYIRNRVACLMDINVEQQKDVLRLIAIWQWGYGTTNMVQLQSLLSPPSGSDFTYNPSSLLICDSCVFISGASQKGPCVFLSKPTVKETWSANFVGKESARIASMAINFTSVRRPDPQTRSKSSNASLGSSVTPQSPRLPYLAIALTDGSLSIWTYEAAVRVTSKTTESVRRLLYPLCKVEGNKLLRQASPVSWETNEITETNNKDIGYCTHLEWISPRASAHNQLLMLAASFQGGVCLYHVALPKIQDKSKKGSSYTSLKAPTDKTQLSQTCSLKPFGMTRFPAVYHQAYVSFCDLGPHLPPSLTVLVTGFETNLDYARVALLTCQLHMHGIKSSKDDSIPSLHTWHSLEFKEAATDLPRGLIPCGSVPGIIYFSDSHLQLVELHQNIITRGGVGSIPAGLTTSGGFHLSDATSDRDGILHVYTTLHCERKKRDDFLEWSLPFRRHWLIQTLIGDRKEATPMGTIPREEKEDEVITSVTSSTVVCELNGLGPISKSIPYRILRHPSDSYTAVWFRFLTGPRKPEQDKPMIGLVDKDEEGKYGVCQILEGRDMVFLPKADSEAIPQFLLLSASGGSVALWRRKPDGTKNWTEAVGTPSRPIVGVNVSTNEYIDCQSLTMVEFQGQIGLIATGMRISNGKSCLIAGKLEDVRDLAWQLILPNIEEDPIFWLEENETISMVLPLPSEKFIRGGVAVSTSSRILILSPDFKLLSSVSVRVSPNSLVPMGSYTAAYASHDDHTIRYLSGVPGSFGESGIMAALPLPHYDYNPNLLIAVRPDRFVYTPWHMGTRLVERGQDSHVFVFPSAISRPALLLEPMIANAIATGKDAANIQPFLESVLEKFGRKVSTMTHTEEEGIGNHGAGITPRVYELLEYYNLRAAASWLLTGTSRFDRSVNSRLLPSWMPAQVKVKAGFNADTHLHVIANGDQYFSEYVKSPDTNMTATLPRPSDPSAFLCQQFALQALSKGGTLDAFKMLDMAGTESSDAKLLQLALALQSDRQKEFSSIFKSLSTSDSQIGKFTDSTTVASLAALALHIQKGEKPDESFSKQWMRPLAPSMQKVRRTGRVRPRIMGESALNTAEETIGMDNKFLASGINESKLVWNEGPNREKENLLMLDHIQEWFGRRRPVVLGKEGAERATGATTLADILAQPDDDSFGENNAEEIEDGWVEGVGEGQKDDDKLSVYYRFSEGEDEDNSWREEGFSDISKFEVKATVVGVNDTARLEESTSSVDEGDSGKVKPIFDLVFDQSGLGMASALAIPASRGGSLDVGIMHGPDHSSRQKCTIEFWFWIPLQLEKEVILMRRTFGSSADDLENVCRASEKTSALWELAVSTKGELEFRTVTGEKINSEPPSVDDNNDGDDDDDDRPKSTIQFSRWNHVCITFKQESLTIAAVNVLVKGSSSCSKSMDFKPPNVEVDEFAGASSLDTILQKSYLIFGLDHPASFRMTEVRVWALERNDDDIRTMMTEYLEPAEMKRKFRVRIKKKGGDGGKLGILSPPKGGLITPKGGLANTKAGLAPPKDSLTPMNPARKGLLAPPKGSDDMATPTSDVGFSAFGGSPVKSMNHGFGGDGFSGFGEESASQTPTGFDTTFGGNSTFQPQQTGTFHQPKASEGFEPMPEAPEAEGVEEFDALEISPLWDSAIPLSEQVRSSAAAALIRGPPATRHFGGNRGGLPDYRELERLGVGAISICGSEKTIVWRDDQVPPGLTYPIGASGAIVSDQMDEDGSEFLCCFLAKDKRMVVFELSTRTVVVELQMTTKLNYWRFLPPEAGEDTLCFMLVTPVGGFHWMPLDESPRPRQVWKRGPELQGKKIVSYEEGGTNGLDGPDMLSKAGMLLVTNPASGGLLEAWLVPVCGDSQAVCATSDVLGACLCRPPDVGYEAWMPLLLFVEEIEDGDLVVNISAIMETAEGSIGLTEVMTDALIEQSPYSGLNFEPPTLAMGTWPEVLCCSLGSTIVIIVRRKGLVVAYELADTGLELIAQENVGHYVVDAVMRYSAVEGGAEIVLLMSDSENPRDGRVGTFCFRTAG